MKVIRWVLLLPSAYAAWWVALFLGIAYVSVLDWLCPPELMVSGLCTATWYEPAFNAAFVVGAGLAAGLIMLAVILMAPSHRRHVAILAFGSGSAFALYAAYETSLWGAFVAAFLTGLVALAVSMKILA